MKFRIFNQQKTIINNNKKYFFIYGPVFIGVNCKIFKDSFDDVIKILGARRKLGKGRINEEGIVDADDVSVTSSARGMYHLFQSSQNLFKITFNRSCNQTKSRFYQLV